MMRLRSFAFWEVEGEWEMFDLKKDPDEMSSIHGSADYVDQQARLEAELKRLREL